MTVRRLCAVACTLAVIGVACGDDAPGRASASPRSTGPRDFGVQELPGEPDGSALCGEYSLVWKSPEIGEEGPRATFTAISGGDIALDLEGKDDFEQLTALWCADVNRDGRLELATERFTGGAHCCWTMRVDTLGGPTLFDRDLGNYGGLEPENLDDEDGLELHGRSDSLAYFGDIPFAASPSLPIVFALRDGTYVEATEDFDDYVRGSLDEAEDDLDKAADGDVDETGLKGLALGVLGHHALLGDEDEGLADLSQRVPDGVASWLREHFDEIVEQVRNPQRPDEEQ